ncbi:MAG: AraC family transcriptional regulator ligand-binding domain-containing protein [Pseudomonadales bacterium]
MNTSATSAGFVHAKVIAALLRLVDELGANSNELAAKAAIDTSLLAVPSASIPVGRYYRLMELVRASIDKPDIGLLFGRINYIEDMHLSLYLASVGHTLKDWLNMVPSISALFGDIGSVRLQNDPNSFALVWHPLQPPDAARCPITDGWLSATALLLASYCLLPLRPLRVDISYRKPQDTSLLHSMLGSALYFEQPRTALHYDRAALRYPLIKVSTRLYSRVAEEFERDFRADRMLADPWQLALHACILRLLPRGELSIEMVAQELEVSRRTLQRRLQERGTNFQQLVQKLKNDLAKKYLGDERMNLVEIAVLLGYGDHSTFSAAFKSWNGQTPSEFRQQILAGIG